MVPVQVRRENDVDVVGSHAGIGERVIQVPPPIQGELLAECLIRLVAETRVDEHGAPAAHEKLADRDLDAIPFVGRVPFTP